jgi:two-component system, OmpR family, sensor kinase
VSIPGGIRVKLALALLAIVGGALGTAYLIVVPQLENRLVEAKLDQLEQSASTVADGLQGSNFVPPFSLDDFVAGSAQTFNSRTVVFQINGPPITLLTLSDSGAAGSRLIQDDPVALRAGQTVTTQRGRVERGGREFAEVAVPLLPSGWVVLLSSPLADQLATVRVVERRLLGAALVALAIAGVLGILVAGVHARRILRLERAADRIARGRFDEPVTDTGKDELGALAAAFERMRVQIAQLDTARKEFVANASHELRTPLFSLGGFLELMADEELDDETRRGFLATMREQVDRLTKLATDLLDLSRMDAGRLRVEHEDVDLADTARILAHELEALAEARGHPLELDVEEDVWAIGDEERVLQIGRALAGNAIVHTPSGTRVVVRARKAGDRVTLAVIDDGPGIPAEQFERIFDRFHRIEGGQASGSGLGLAIARELAGLMGGEVRVESRPGRTVFTLLLPAQRALGRAPELVEA